MTNKILSYLLVLLSILIMGCKEVNVKTSGQSLSEQQINYLEKRLELLEKKVHTIESSIKNNSLESIPDESNNSVEAIVEGLNFTELRSELTDPTFKNDIKSQADIVVIVFTDLLCKTCRVFIKETLPKLKNWIADREKAELVVKDFPLSTDTNSASKKAAVAGNCISESSDYWSFIALLDNAPKDIEDFLDISGKLPNIDYDSFRTCIFSDKYDREILEDKEQGKALGVKGVPSIFVGKRASENNFKGTLIRGNQPADTVISIMNKTADAVSGSK